jgi:hypothetical protein
MSLRDVLSLLISRDNVEKRPVELQPWNVVNKEAAVDELRAGKAGVGIAARQGAEQF